MIIPQLSKFVTKLRVDLSAAPSDSALLGMQNGLWLLPLPFQCVSPKNGWTDGRAGPALIGEWGSAAQTKECRMPPIHNATPERRATTIRVALQKELIKEGHSLSGLSHIGTPLNCDPPHIQQKSKLVPLDTPLILYILEAAYDRVIDLFYGWLPRCLSLTSQCATPINPPVLLLLLPPSPSPAPLIFLCMS